MINSNKRVRKNGGKLLKYSIVALLILFGISFSTIVSYQPVHAVPSVDYPEYSHASFDSVFITTYSLPDGEESLSYSATIYATGGTTPYTWTFVGGLLPSGLTFYSTNNVAYITGTPKKGSAGSYSISVTVQDSSDPVLTDSQTFTIYIEEGTFEPTITIDSNLEAGSTTVKANGSTITSLKGGESTTLTLPIGTSRTITVESIVEDPTEEGVRYVATADSQVLNESNPNITFNYTKEYEVNVMTNPSSVASLSGSGWYKKDATVTVNARAEVNTTSDTLYKFSYWQLPDNQQIDSESINFVVDKPGTLTAFYDTYYKLTIKSEYGQVNGGGFYKSGTEATWSVSEESVPVPGLLGFFQAKYEAKNPSGIETMDAPKTVTVFWEANYLWPYILIPLSIALLMLAIYGIYLLVKRQSPRPIPHAAAGVSPYGPPYVPPMQAAPRPIPQQHTTVVMIGDQSEKKQLASGTKEQLMEKFAQLLDTYESEIRTSSGMRPEAPQLKSTTDKMLNAPPPGAPTENIYEAEFVKEDIGPRCGVTAKKLLRTVTGTWQQLESSTTELPSDKEDGETETGLAITWSRDIYHEWEILNCTLPVNHTGKHRGDIVIVYSLLNTITMKQTYKQDQPVVPPSPHFTDSMPEIDADAVEIVSEEELPQ